MFNFIILTAGLINAVVVLNSCYHLDLRKAPEAAVYAGEFEALTGQDTTDVIFRFGGTGATPGAPNEPGSDTIAACYRSSSLSVIVINEEVFRGMDYYNRKALVWHELSHCVLHKKHIDVDITCNGQKYKHLMHSYLGDENITPTLIECYKNILKKH